MRRLFYILLLISLPLQSFASQVAGLRLSALAGVSHEIEHLGDLHHHGDDGSIHYDNSDESIAHADEHSAATQLPLLNPAAMLFSASPASLAEYPDPASHLPNPCLDDPQRPPSFAPGLAAGG